MNIAELQQQVHALAVSKGWWDDSIDPDWGTRGEPDHDRIAVALALVHSEVSEALEEVRGDNLGTYWMVGRSDATRFDDRDEAPAGAKPEGLPIELADVIIRVLDLAGALGIDMEQAIADKAAYNATRTHRHGGRKL